MLKTSYKNGYEVFRDNRKADVIAAQWSGQSGRSEVRLQRSSKDFGFILSKKKNPWKVFKRGVVDLTDLLCKSYQSDCSEAWTVPEASGGVQCTVVSKGETDIYSRDGATQLARKLSLRTGIKNDLPFLQPTTGSAVLPFIETMKSREQSI